MPRRGWTLIVVVVLGLVVSGCASTSLLPGHGGSSSCAGHAHQDGPAAPADEVAVVCQWSTALQAGDVSRAAGFFHLPSIFEDGTALPVRTGRQATIVNESLSCGAKVISAFRQGHFINVLFRLIARRGPGGGAAACGAGVGESARTVFLIHHGRIYEWLRAPSRAGDPGTSGSSGGSGNSGGSSL